MKKYERLLAKKRELEAARNTAIRQGMALTVAQISQHIRDLDEEIAEAAKYEPMSLKTILAEQGVSTAQFVTPILELHLAADYLNDCAISLKEHFKKIGVEWCSLFPFVETIDKVSGELAGLVCGEYFPKTQDILLEDERLIDDFHLLANRYLKKKME